MNKSTDPNQLGYPIVFDDALKSLISICSEYHHKIIIGVDSNTHKYCLPIIENQISPFISHVIIVPANDANKNIIQAQHIYSELIAAKADRKSLLLIVGGGMCGDLFAFAASTFKRGIPFIQVPSSLLAMVDASVGSKNAINYNSYKNLLGTFSDPKAVLVHLPFLQTLPLREKVSAFAECFKHAILDSHDHFNLVTQKIKEGHIADLELITASIDFKSKIVKSDPFEKGLRKILNFGHTIGHALEALSHASNNPMLHGEAIAAGMIAELFLAKVKCGFNENLYTEISSFIRSHWKFKLPDQNLESIIQLIQQDKKNLDDQYAFSLPSDIGKCNTDVICTQVEISMAIEVLYHEL